jgi:hypothetical protein
MGKETSTFNADLDLDVIALLHLNAAVDCTSQRFKDYNTVFTGSPGSVPLNTHRLRS